MVPASRAAGRKSVTDSPWYWVYMFSVAGLVALFLMGSKFESRQVQIERKGQARQRAVQQVAGRQPNTPLSSESRTVVRLWPLYGVLSVLLVVAVVNLYRGRAGRRALE